MSFRESRKRLRRKGKSRRPRLLKERKRKRNLDFTEKKGLVNMQKLRKMLLPEEM